MSKYKVDITGIDTSALITLKNEEMLSLFDKYKNGDLNAKETLINGNLKLVLSIISKFRNKNMDMNDLFQVGCIGLIKAVDNFDPNFGVMFSTYAVPLILGEVRRLVRSNTSVRVARSIRDTAYKILKFKEEYASIYGIEPKNELISKELNISEFDIKLALESLIEPVSIYEPIYNDGGDTIYLLDQLKDKTDIKDQEMILELKAALDRIKPREKDILIDRYIIGQTQSEIAEKYHVSQAQISRLEKSAIKSIKNLMS